MRFACTARRVFFTVILNCARQQLVNEQVWSNMSNSPPLSSLHKSEIVFHLFLLCQLKRSELILLFKEH